MSHSFVHDMSAALPKDVAAARRRRTNEKSLMSLSGLNTTRSILSTSYNTSFSAAISQSIKTPGKNADLKGLRKTPGKANDGGDRFIPNRGTTNFEMANFLLKHEREKSDEENANGEGNTQVSAKKAARQRLIADAANMGDTKSHRVLSFRSKAPAPPESHTNPLRIVYSTKTPASAKSGTRYIPTTSDRILDAPDFINDYYLNLMDWSHDNIVAVALGTSVYLWNAATGNIEQLTEYAEGDYACAVSWIQEGQILAIGNNTGAVELWDCSKNKRLRVMEGHTARAVSLAWNSFLVSSGSRDGSIIHHDVRAREHGVGTLNGHTLEVCGLKWSTDYRYLASGGNDNLVNVWSRAGGSGGGTATEPVHSFNEHQAAVRALAWCPWQSNVLASGGGTADRCIKFWNVNNGTMTKSVDTKSQVCALLFSSHYKELISAHGFANNQLTIWKYPSMVKQTDLTGHTSRVLQMAMSPDGSTVISAGADETLRLWNCFAPDPNAAKKTAARRNTHSAFLQTLR